MFPTLSEYNSAIRNANGQTFRTLQGLQFVPSRRVPVPIYNYGSGSYAVVFKAKEGLKQYAVRCFISAESENISRYRSIIQFLAGNNAEWITPLELYEQEIRVNGEYYPVIRMPWVEGVLLNSFVGQILQDNGMLTTLQNAISCLSQQLEAAGIGHGDIQSGNILVQSMPNGHFNLKLIDYDGMYIPSFAGKQNLEKGRSEFQHPRRSVQDFNERIDRFSFWVILCALEALKFDKSLWLEVMQGGFNTLDNLLFSGEDFIHFNDSKLVKRLRSLQQDSINYYLQALGNSLHAQVSNIAPVKTYTPSINSNSPVSKQADTPVTNSLKKITIITVPAGAKVLDEFYKVLGSTPYSLEVAIFRNRKLRISYNNQINEVIVTDSSGDIWISFDKASTSETSPTNTGTNTTGSPASTPSGGHMASPTPTNTIPITPQKDYTALWAVLLVVFVIGFGIFIANQNKQKTNNYDYTAADTTMITVDTAAVTVDTAVAYYPEVDTTSMGVTLDTAAAAYDWTETQSSTSSDEQITQPTITDQSGRTAQDIVKHFLISLGNHNCDAAWNVSYVKRWEDRGKNWFCSTDAFGSVNQVRIDEIYTISEDNNYAEVYVKYFASDPINGNQCMQQIFKAEKRYTNSGESVWMIIEVNNWRQPVACQ